MVYVNYVIVYKYEIIGNKEKYIYYMFKFLFYFEKYKIRYDKLVNGYENLVVSFGDNNDLKFSEKYSRKVLELSYESKNQINIVNVLIGWVLFFVNSVE